MELLHDPEFWEALIFLGVVVLIYKKAAGGIMAGLDSRAAKIREQIEEARKLREDAQSLLAEYQRKTRDAMMEAEKIIAEARKEAARLKTEAEADLEGALTRRKQQALDRIAQSEAQALIEVRNTAIDVALKAAEKVIRENLEPARKQALADKAIAEISSRLN